MIVVKGKRKFSITKHLSKFSKIANKSKEYQGHGWGCSWLDKGIWKHYKNINPIWKDDLNKFGETQLLVAHARSAFQNKGIRIENNMPFCKDDSIFVFNGELRGVRIKEEGRIGAEKIFNIIRKFGINVEGFVESTNFIESRSKFVKALNFIIVNKEKIVVNSFFNEDPEYFTLYLKNENETIVCSEPYSEDGWIAIPNKSVTEI
jgi:predicted glutamine amidotransferase